MASTSLTKQQKDYLQDKYYSLSGPTTFSGIEKLWRLIRKDKIVSKFELRRWLKQQDAYTSFVPARRKFKRPKVISPYFGYMFGSDTAYFQHISDSNDGFKYVCVFIDYFTRFAYTFPLKTLTGVEMKQCLELLFKQYKPERLHTDSGTEYKNRTVSTYLRQNNVKHIVTGSDNKSAMSEAFIKRLKLNLYRYMFYKNKYRWVDVLEQFTKIYNESIHSAIKMSPKDAKNAERYVVWKNQFYKPPKRQNRPQKPLKGIPFRFNINDKVKISVAKTKFTREWNEKFTNETFRIKSRKIMDGIPMYLLEDGTGDVIKGFFYEPEMTKVVVPNDKLYKIEKVLKQRTRRGRKEQLVKFQGFSNKYNEWIAVKDIEKI